MINDIITVSFDDYYTIDYAKKFGVYFMKKLFLVCNAHLDPVWLWQRAEGMAEAMATFRIAADFCEKYDGFVFNHNESVLYEWVMHNEPELIQRIKHLVKKGRWRIM